MTQTEIQDLDQYLDDVLEEFAEPKEEVKEEVPQEETFQNQEEFMKLLQENMAKLMNQEDAFSDETLGELKVKGNATAISPPAIPDRSSAADGFQDTISQTLQKLKTSSHQAEAKSTSNNPTHALFGEMDGDSMEQMMKELEGMMETGEFEDMFGGIVNQLASRDLLYEPMKDLALKYPEWLLENKSIISSEETERYTAQHKIVLQIIDVFDRCGEKEPNEEEGQKVVDLMQEMQTFGNPPEGLMKTLVPGMEAPLGGSGDAVPNECKNM